MTFFGHSDKISFFQKITENGTLGHAYLFYGDKGIGKATFANLFASFLEIGSFSAEKTTLIDSRVFSTDDKGKIGIDEARNLKRFLFQFPLRSSRRTAIIDNAEFLTPEAEAALLKIVEEPPRSSLLIFVAVNKESFSPPLVSRLTRVYFRRFSKKEIAGILRDYFNIQKSRAEEISRDSFGSLETAISFAGRNENKKEEDAFGIILRLRRDLKKNSSALRELLVRHEAMERYNTNARLQLKAIEHILRLHGIR